MLILLPPSETKRDGGNNDSLDLGSLAFPALTPLRRRAISSVRSLARNRPATIAALKLGPKQHAEVERNRLVAASPTMPAIDRYTGVLYDAFGADSLSAAQRTFAHDHVAIHSALLGPVAALDLIPAYRLSFDSRLPTLSLKKHWSSPVSAELSKHDGLILDLRSEGYARLGASPDRTNSLYVRVVTRDENGQKRALNHFNKQAKGLFVRAIVSSGVVLDDTVSLLDWAATEGYEMNIVAGELEIVVPAVTGDAGSLMASLRPVERPF
jgi:cytoplasmic iron level regulating protein YaaA (DUF328/UPF0246 family)